jgi:hypothetical protein
MDDLSTVVRIPIAGPQPFNTLVAVHESGFATGIGHETKNYPGGWSRVTAQFETNFALVDFRPPPHRTPFHHSTTAAIQLLHLSDDCTFHASIESVTAAFNPKGTWVVDLEAVTDIPGGNFIEMTGYISSWVLCNEPRDDEEDARFHDFFPGSENIAVNVSGREELMRPFG